AMQRRVQWWVTGQVCGLAEALDSRLYDWHCAGLRSDYPGRLDPAGSRSAINPDLHAQPAAGHCAAAAGAALVRSWRGQPDLRPGAFGALAAGIEQDRKSTR